MLKLFLNRAHIRHGRAYLLIVFAVACIGWGLYSLVENWQPETDNHLRLAAGSAVERRFQIAQCLAGEAHACGLDIEVVPTKGFNDAIEQVTSGKLDAAVVSSGLQTKGCENVRLLAGLDVSPLHILVRSELVTPGASLLQILKGRRVNLGEPGTNDHQLAHDLMSFLRLNPIDRSGAGDYTELSLSKDELSQLANQVQSLTGTEREARLRDLPDAAMIVSSTPSRVTQRLLDTGAYCLVPFPYAQPFLRSNLEDGQAGGNTLNRLFVEPATIPTAMYLGNSIIPASDSPTVGMRSLLVARADLSPHLVERLMQAVFETDFNSRIKPLPPQQITTAYEIHAGAQAYLDRDKPLITGHFFESINKALSVFGAFSAGALSLYGYLRRRRIRRPGEYLEEIRVVDALAAGRQSDGDSPATREELARQLDTRLVNLKEQLIHDYCDNRVQGELVLMSILSMLADSRAELRRASPRPSDAKLSEDNNSASRLSRTSRQAA